MGSSIRSLFTFKYSSLVLPCSMSLAVAAVMSKYYQPAYIIFLLSGVWALIQWFLSKPRKRTTERLFRMNLNAKKYGDKYNKLAEFKRRSRIHVVKDCAICLLIVSMTAPLLYWTYNEQTQYYAEEERKELSLAYGKLYPRHEPIPENACPSHGHSNDEFRVFLTLNPSVETIVGVVGEFPRTVVRKAKNGTILVSIDKNADGSISPSLEIKDAQGIALVRIIKGEFDINRHHTFGDRPRQDKSHLKVDDETSKTVLDLDFFNPLAMRIALNIKEADHLGELGLITKEVCYGTFPGASLRGEPIFEFGL